MRKLLRTVIIILLAVIIIVSAVLVVRTVDFKKDSPKSSIDIAPISTEATDGELKEYARQILFAVAERDYAAISDVAHADFGIIFAPYSTVNLTTDRCFTASQIEKFGKDRQKYIWGVHNTSGEPIELTPNEYFDDFVFDADFTKCENFGIDEILRSGNALENTTEVFPEARFVDCYMPGEGEEDWKSLRLVFEEKDGLLFLTAIIHSEYTI